MAEVRRDLHVLSDPVARIEGALTGPWRPPTNGGTSNQVAPPAAASEVPQCAHSSSPVARSALRAFGGAVV